ncbi:MAG TPA: hypothetical protein VKF81_15185 [Blastocatellia bacterium]|nr:hypothetical protein [Blastocatellia bacterium]
MSWLDLELEKTAGSTNRLSAAINTLLLTDSSSFKQLAALENRARQHGLYQRFTQILTRALRTSQAVSECGEKLIYVADQAYAARQFDVLGYLGQLLANLSSTHESAGQYYQALHLNHKSLEDIPYARSLFEDVADDAQSQYRHRAILALGGKFVREGDFRTAMSVYRDVSQLMTCDHIFDPVTACVTNRMTAVIKGLEGDHNGAVANLERLFPLARIAGSLQPYAYYDYLNTLAVELGEVGRVVQARRLSEIAITSPFAAAYPEWHETFDDIEHRQRRASSSAVAVPKQVEQTVNARLRKQVRGDSRNRPAPQTREMLGPQLKQWGNLVLLPVPKRRFDKTTGKKNGRVLSFKKWKMASQKPSHLQPEKLTPEERELLTTPQKLIRIIDLISRDETDDAAIDRILDAVEEITLGRPEDQVG